MTESYMSRISVLIVEDSPSDAELMVLKLAEEGYEVKHRIVEREGDYLEALNDEPDVILSDWALPAFSGLGALKLLKERGLDIPFIVVTGSIGEEAAVEAIRTGAYDFVLKDRLGRLGQSVRRAIEEKRMRKEKRLAEEELRDSRQEMANLMDNIQGMVYSCLNDRDWTMTFVSQGCLDLTGYRSYELLDSTVVSYNELIHPDDRQYVWDAVQAALEKASPYVLEYRIIARDGTIKWVWEKGRGVFNSDGSLICLEGLINDISERKRMEAERERLIAAIEQAGEVIFLTDRDGEIIYVNPAFEPVTGYTKEEAIGRNPRMLKSGKQDQAFYQNLWDTIKAGKTWKGRMVNRRKDGSLYTEETTISPVLDGSGRLLNYVAVKKDITAQLEMEEQFQQAQKMESIGRLAGGVAHDFNNMLGVIIGQAELALDEPGIDEKLKAGLNEIRKAAERSANLTRQLLAFARKQAIAPRVIDLNQAVEGLLKMMRRLIGEDIALTWLPASNLWAVKMDPSQVDQILANLCVNSRDAIGGAGSVTVQTANHSFDETFCKSHKEFSQGEYVCLAVSDDGCGMEEKTIEHLFEPFFTTKEVGRGTGLGLATVYGIVKQNRGFIIVDSFPGKGTTFEIYIPRHEEQLAEQKADKPEPSEKGKGETVMVVEDDPSLLLLISRILTGLGYRVLAAASGEPALAMAESHQGPIHLLISDVIMPGMDGRALAQSLRAERPKMKVLFVSGYPADILARKGLVEEGVSFLSKPFSAPGLAGKVRKVLEGNDE